jgi:transposase-like protein
VSDMPFADPVKNLDYWVVCDQIVEKRSRGVSVAEIAVELGMTTPTIHRFMAKAAERARDSVRQRVEEAFLLSDVRLENLYRVIQDRIDTMVADGVFDDKVIRAAVLVLERQSKLLDLDRAKRGSAGAASRAGMNEWVETASFEELYKVATETYGITLPPVEAFA